MWIILVLLLVALVVVYALGRSNPAAMRPVLIGLAALIVVLSLVRVFRGSRTGVPVVSGDYWEAVGYRLGQAVADEVGQGEVVVVDSAYNAATRRYAEARRRGLEKGVAGRGVTLRHVRAASEMEDRYSPESLALQAGQWSAQLLRWAGAHPEAAGLVLCMDLPMDFDAEVAARLPPLFVVAHDFERVRPWVEQGQVRAAVWFAPMTGWDQDPPRGASLDQLFDQGCRLVTAADVDEVPAAGFGLP